MVISGKPIAAAIHEELKKQVEKLKSSGTNPKIAIVTVGDEGAWKTYVGQKIKLAEKLGIEKEFVALEQPNEQELLTTVQKLNDDKNVHGIIVQRPIPKELNINKQTITNAILPKKDIDGFRDDSPYKVPVWLATLRFLQEVYTLEINQMPNPQQYPAFESWLKSKTLVIIGKGETAGAPAISELKSMNIDPIVIDSKTQDVDTKLKSADIIITSIGKRVVNKDNIKSGVVLIGVGTHRGVEKLEGDYDESEIAEIASYYTPTPGGVGPVNLAYLFTNLLTAAASA